MSVCGEVAHESADNPQAKNKSGKSGSKHQRGMVLEYWDYMTDLHKSLAPQARNQTGEPQPSLSPFIRACSYSK